MLQWFEKVYFAKKIKKLLFINSWKSYRDRELVDKITSVGKQVLVKTIPLKATGMIQP